MKTTFDKLVLADPFGECKKEGFIADLNDMRYFDPAVGNLYKLLGLRTFLLPLGADGKPAVEKGVDWKSMPVEETFRAAFQANLRSSHLAVRTGRPSGNLCAGLFREQRHFEQFVKLNPAAQSTLITGCPEGTAAWFRIEGWAPDSLPAPGMEWLSTDNYLPVFQRQSDIGPMYYWVQQPAHSPLRIAWHDLKLDPSLAKVFRPLELEATFGKAFLADGRPNDNFWCAYFAREKEVAFNPALGEFCLLDKGLWKPVDSLIILSELQQFLLSLKDKPHLSILERYAQAQHLNRLLKTLKIVAVIKSQAAYDGLAEFLRKNVERAKGFNLPTRELFEAYTRDPAATRSDVYAEKVFYDELPNLMARLFKSSRSGSCRRASADNSTTSNPRAYRGVRFKSQRDPTPGARGGTP